MRIDQQQRVPAYRVRRCDRNAVRAARIRRHAVSRHELLLDRVRTVESAKVSCADAFNVPTDASFAECKRHPRFEPGDHARFHRRVRCQIEVQTVGEPVHETLQPLRAGPVQSLHRVGMDEEFHPKVLVNRRFPLCFGQAAHRIDVVGLDAIEIVLRLGVDHAEHGVRVCLRIHMRDSPVITYDGDVRRASFPSVCFRVLGLRQGREDTQQEERPA